MSACTQWRDRLVDRALGDGASPALTQHLAACPGCSAALDGLRARMGELDAALQTLVDHQPSKDFAAQVMARIGSPHPRLVRAWPAPRAAAGIALAASLLVAAYEIGGLSRQRAQATAVASAGAAIAHWRAPSDVLLKNLPI